MSFLGQVDRYNMVNIIKYYVVVRMNTPDRVGKKMCKQK